MLNVESAIRRNIKLQNFNSNTDNKDEWLTPRFILNSLGAFDLDPCAPVDKLRPWDTAHIHYSKEDNGLSKEWKGRVWCNPPYGKNTFLWIRKLANHGNGIALIFARTETRGFHSEIWNKADSIFFLKGRLKFHHITGEQGGTANAPSCLVAYGKNNDEILKGLNLEGKYIKL